MIVVAVIVHGEESLYGGFYRPKYAVCFPQFPEFDLKLIDLNRDVLVKSIYELAVHMIAEYNRQDRPIEIISDSTVIKDRIEQLKNQYGSRFDSDAIWSSYFLTVEGPKVQFQELTMTVSTDEYRLLEKATNSSKETFLHGLWKRLFN